MGVGRIARVDEQTRSDDHGSAVGGETPISILQATGTLGMKLVADGKWAKVSVLAS